MTLFCKKTHLVFSRGLLSEMGSERPGSWETYKDESRIGKISGGSWALTTWKENLHCMAKRRTRSTS